MCYYTTTARMTADAHFDVLNPSTGAAFNRAPHANQAMVDAAVAAANAAFPAWASTPLADRRKALRAARDAIHAHREELARLLTTEQGKPLASAQGELGGVVMLMDKALATDIPIDVYEDTATKRIEVHRKPIGVVACLCPWNFPLFCSVQKWSPALVFGNTCVVKPSPFTPLTSLAVAELVKDCFPPGVLNIVSGDDKQDFNVGAHLSNHPDVHKVSFTGSVRTGTKVMACCAPAVRRVTLEMGGNDPAIVRADCDPAEAAKGVFAGAFANTGQVCCAIKRCFVHESIFDRFKEEIVRCAEQARVGDGMAEGVEYGPLNNRMQFDKVTELVEDARTNGAEICCGGKVPDGAGKGFFYAPTIIAGVKEGDRIVDEEQFGPALPIMSYATDDEAIRRANASPYGLGGSVWTKDVAAGNKLATRILSGTVWVNAHMDLTGAPFGGFRQSGIGRELGKADLDTFTECQTLQLAK